MTALPPPRQTWIHAVDNRRTLLEALKDDKITAIETDLLMGTSSTAAGTIPIMAHPPNTSSDLPMMEFLRLVSTPSTTTTTTTPTTTTTAAAKGIQKVIKLDFKEPETVEPTLKAIVEMKLQTTGDNAIIYLNADILPGPGNRQKGAVTMDAKEFLETCISYMELSTARIAFSLGYKTDFSDPDGYTADDVKAMAKLMTKHKLVEQKIGVVLALNARQLLKSVEQFETIMKEFPHLQILAWTGKGEPPIPKTSYESLQDYFHEQGMAQRIGYDCQITNSYLIGVGTEVAVSLWGYFKRLV